MQPYQEEYIANLREIARLTARKKASGQSFDAFLSELALNGEAARRIACRNNDLLREKLFPMLDHLPQATVEDLQDLQVFAGELMTWGKELDTGLFCQIHQALLNLARLNKDRNSMIRELYWLGMGCNSLYNKTIGLEVPGAEKYTSQMRLCFAEAAAYLKYFDEIPDTDTRGYILRSRANMSLGTFKTASEKIRLVKQTLQILQDADYRQTEPDLPWDRYLSMTHQQMAASISHSREQSMSPEDITDVMESVYIVYNTQFQEAAARGEQPPVRYAFPYNAIEYYCGLITLDTLLTRLEDLMDHADSTDYSANGMYALVSLPAFYCQYLQEYPDLVPRRTEYIASLYEKILQYVDAFPGTEKSEHLFLYLRQLSVTFLETDNSISYSTFMQKLMIRFAPETYIHSRIVAMAATAFCDMILEEDPSFFDDMEEVRYILDMSEKRHLLLDYAMESGTLHDVGKLNFMNLYSQTGRQWFKEEYEMAQLHTAVGNSYLSSRFSTRPYAAVAHGHHTWYDASRGYPESYKRLECPYRQMVDVIGLVDWLENVTNTAQLRIGVDKTFEDAIADAIALEGKRFSPLLTARLRDSQVAERLRQAFDAGFQDACRHLYEDAV